MNEPLFTRDTIMPPLKSRRAWGFVPSSMYRPLAMKTPPVTRCSRADSGFPIDCATRKLLQMSVPARATVVVPGTPNAFSTSLLTSRSATPPSVTVRLPCSVTYLLLLLAMNTPPVIENVWPLATHRLPPFCSSGTDAPVSAPLRACVISILPLARTVGWLTRSCPNELTLPSPGSNTTGPPAQLWTVRTLLFVGPLRIPPIVNGEPAVTPNWATALGAIDTVLFACVLTLAASPTRMSVLFTKKMLLVGVDGTAPSGPSPSRQR